MMYVNVEDNGLVRQVADTRTTEEQVEIVNMSMGDMKPELGFDYFFKAPNKVVEVPREKTDHDLYAESLQTLKETDWYILRYLDPTSEEPIPLEVLEKRQSARDKIKVIKPRLNLNSRGNI